MPANITPTRRSWTNLPFPSRIMAKLSGILRQRPGRRCWRSGPRTTGFSRTEVWVMHGWPPSLHRCPRPSHLTPSTTGRKKWPSDGRGDSPRARRPWSRSCRGKPYSDTCFHTHITPRPACSSTARLRFSMNGNFILSYTPPHTTLSR